MISGPVVIDASVAIEYLVNLRHTDQATRLFRSALDRSEVEFWAPDLIYTEAVLALRKMVKLRAITPKVGVTTVDKLAQLPITTVGTGPLVTEMWKLKDFLTAYDACYVALSRSLRAPLITADAKLARALLRSKDKVIDLSTLVY
jgi:predicted nucleic acid-binding protein